MQVSVSHDPRANQKLRTRSAIVDAAIALIARGERPTVAEAAAEAKVSRATAYRYFTTQDSLLIEAAAIGPVSEIEALLAAPPGKDPRANFLEIQKRLNAVILREEGAMRMALRAYLDAWFVAVQSGENRPDVREGRRDRWIATSLAPLLEKLPPERAEKLRAGLALTMGVEPVVVMKDVCRLNDEEAQDMLRSIAETLIEAAMRE